MKLNFKKKITDGNVKNQNTQIQIIYELREFQDAWNTFLSTRFIILSSEMRKSASIFVH